MQFVKNIKFPNALCNMEIAVVILQGENKAELTVFSGNQAKNPHGKLVSRAIKYPNLIFLPPFNQTNYQSEHIQTSTYIYHAFLL